MICSRPRKCEYLYIKLSRTRRSFVKPSTTQFWKRSICLTNYEMLPISTENFITSIEVSPRSFFPLFTYIFTESIKTIFHLNVSSRLQAVSQFATDLIGCARTVEEVEEILKQSTGFALSSKFLYPRLLFALHNKQRSFVAHPNIQQVVKKMNNLLL